MDISQEDIARINRQVGGGVVNFYNQTQNETLVRYGEEVAKKELEIWSAKKKAEILADVASKKEWQGLKVEIHRGKEVIITKEQFDKNLSRKASVTVMGYEILICPEYENDKLLHVIIRTEMTEKNVFFCYRKMDDRYINKKCNSAGINFGFSNEKETRIRKLLLAKIMEDAPVFIIPLKTGWYKQDGAIKFAFPETCTWEVLAPYV